MIDLINICEFLGVLLYGILSRLRFNANAERRRNQM